MHWYKKYIDLLIISLVLGLVMVGNTQASAQSTSAADQVSSTDPDNTKKISDVITDKYLQNDIINSLHNNTITSEVTAESPASELVTFARSQTFLYLGSNKIQDFKQLKGLRYLPSNIVIYNQDLSDNNANLTDLLDTLKSLDTYYASPLTLALFNDKISNSGLTKIVSFIKGLNGEMFDPFSISLLNLSENEITDFSSLQNLYAPSDPQEAKIYEFVAWGQHHDESEKGLSQLSPQTVVGNKISIDYKKLLPLAMYQNKMSSFFQSNNTQSAYFRLHPEANQDGLDSLVTSGDNLINRQANGEPLAEPSIAQPAPSISTGLSNFNTYDYQMNATTQYRQWLAQSERDSLISSMALTNNQPNESIPVDPQITNIPSGTKSIQVRAAFYRTASGYYDGLTQDYNIPLKWPSSSSTETSTSTPASATSTTSANTTATTEVSKQTVVYATKKIGLYGDATFTKKVRQHWYPKQRRIYRPMFKVTGYAKSTAGRARYLVKDVNHHSKTYGDTGYITTRAAYVQPVYYQQASKKITVINPQGVNAYRQKSLTGKAHHYRQGQVLTVKKLVRHNLTTRYVLKNGEYLTANKKLVQNGRIKSAKSIKTKTPINRYRDVNFTKRQRHYRKHATIAIKGWDYSAAGTKRYRVAGGYITANSRFIHVVK
ncbi:MULTISPECIES: DUF5776 domain-containing protein [Levilactobacillus]|uniref:DUF5776 domain-containing protein n=2 Tax=Lactobacillaceae TaxID=33958 RepID=UPI00375689FF